MYMQDVRVMPKQQVIDVVAMNGSSDYVEVYVYGSDESGSPRLKGSSFQESVFGAFLLTT